MFNLNIYINVMFWKNNTIAISKSNILSLINIVKIVSAINKDNNINDATKYLRTFTTLEDYCNVVDDCDIIKHDLIDIDNVDNIDIKIIEEL